MEAIEGGGPMNDASKKKCFVISPIGADGSDVRNAADWFQTQAIGDAITSYIGGGGPLV